jgi:hypothetical protein
MRLRDGKSFHKRVQEEWARTAEGAPRSERSCCKPNGKTGRIDIHVAVDEGLVALVEIKNTDWDRMSLSAVRRNASRHARQVWDYIRSQLEGIQEDRGKDVCPGIIFPRRPTGPERLKLVEELFEGEGIPVVWEDETVEERTAR